MAELGWAEDEAAQFTKALRQVGYAAATRVLSTDAF
jgi:hypothetical protein